MNRVIGTSETLMGSLCKEADYIRIRIPDLISLIGKCRNLELLSRLIQEKDYLDSRRVQIISIVDSLRKRNLIDNISTKFLLEICNRLIK